MTGLHGPAPRALERRRRASCPPWWLFPPRARAFDAIGSAGHVIGHVNHGNLLVATDATVRLIDTDSSQVTEPAGRGLAAWT